MITSFEVGAVFKIINEASPALGRILKQVRDLRKAIDGARADLAEFSKAVAPGINGAVAETDRLSAAWKGVSESAAAASKAIQTSAKSARESAAAATGSVGGGAGGGRRGFASRILPGGHGGGGGHGVGGLAMGGLAADAIYQAAELEKEAYLTWWHSGMADTADSRKRIRDIIQEATAKTGYSFKDVGEASEDIFRLMKGTPNNGLDAAPELLRAGASEALLKGTGLKESVRSMIEMAHMMGIYDPEQLKAMAPVIGFLSTANPASLPQMTRSASYSIPTLSNALGINAGTVLLENTAIARAGATGSKSGTWVEHAFDRALPPDPHTMGAAAYYRRMWAMQKAGLVDANNKSTIIGADGRIDINKFLNQTREALGKLPLEVRNSVEKQVFGEQGARGYELMTSPTVMDQTGKIQKEIPDFVPKYNAFLGQYQDNSVIQQARTTYSTFNNLLSDIGNTVLPSVNRGLGELKSVLERLQGVAPSSPTPGKDADRKWSVGTTALEGMAIGAGVGSMFAGVGAIPGSGIGLLSGAGLAVVHNAAIDAAAGKIGEAASQSMGAAMRNITGPGGFQPLRPGPPSVHVQQPIVFQLDKYALGRVMAEFDISNGQSTQAPAFDGLGMFSNGGSQHSDK